MSGRSLKILLLSAAVVFFGLLFISLALPKKTVVAINDAVSQTDSAANVKEFSGSGANSASPTKTAVNPLPLNTTLIFGGDVMLSRVVGQRMVRYWNFSWPFQKIKDILSSADIAAINLESPFIIGDSHLVYSGSLIFNADPRAVAGLKDAGVDLVTLANNHFLNQGIKGEQDTFKLLSDQGIEYVGAGNNSEQAHQGRIIEKNGIKFGFLGYGYPNDNSVAGPDHPGIANMDLALAEGDIKRMKQRADVVIIMMHDGIEYTDIPNDQQKEFARAMIDAGADLVVGHHPHWVQRVEIYQGRPIIYSLGNLIFDQMWSQETREGALAKVDFSDKKIKSLEFIPVIINDYGQPQIVTDQAEKNKILKRMGLERGTIDF